MRSQIKGGEGGKLLNRGLKRKTQDKACHLKEKQAAGWKGEEGTSDERPLGGDKGGREKQESPRRRLGGDGDGVVERSRSWEVSLVKAQPVGGAWTLLQSRSQAVLRQGAVLQGVGEEHVKEPAFQGWSWKSFSRTATSDAPPVCKGGQVDDDDEEDGEEDANGDRGEVGRLPDWHQAAGLGERAALTLHQLDGEGGRGAGHLHLVLNPRQDLLQIGKLVGAVAGPWIVGKSESG